MDILVLWEALEALAAKPSATEQCCLPPASTSGVGNMPTASLITTDFDLFSNGLSRRKAFIQLMIYWMADTCVICAWSNVCYVGTSSSRIGRVKLSRRNKEILHFKNIVEMVYSHKRVIKLFIVHSNVTNGQCKNGKNQKSTQLTPFFYSLVCLHVEDNYVLMFQIQVWRMGYFMSIRSMEKWHGSKWLDRAQIGMLWYASRNQMMWKKLCKSPTTNCSLAVR